MVMPRIEPGAAGYDTQTLPLCYAANINDMRLLSVL